ncbi:hypothetical protein D9M71_632460 [compost metagenome]
MDGQHLERGHRVVEPFRQSNFDGNHAFIGLRFLDDFPAVDDAEALPRALASRLDVRADTGSGQSLERLVQPLVTLAIGAPVRRHKEVVHGKAHSAVFGIVTPTIQRLCELRHNVDQHVFVVLGGAA